MQSIRQKKILFLVLALGGSFFWTNTSQAAVPTVSAGNIAVDASAASGTAGVYKIGDSVTATWDNSLSGDNNGTVTFVVMNFSEFEGDSTVLAYDDGTNGCDATASDNIWTACAYIADGSLDGVAGKKVSVSVVNGSGTTVTADDDTYTVDNVRPANVTLTSYPHPLKRSDMQNFSIAGVGPASSGIIWELYDEAGKGLSGQVTSDASGNFSLEDEDVSSLEDGDFSLYVSAVDTAGNYSESYYDGKTLSASSPLRYGKDWVLYRYYEKQYKSKKHKERFLLAKTLRKSNTKEFNRIKDIYKQYKHAGKKVIKALPEKTKNDFDMYKSYLGYKEYKYYKDQVNR